MKFRKLSAAAVTIAAFSHAAAATAADGLYTQSLCYDPATHAPVGVPPEITHAGGTPFASLRAACDGPMGQWKGLGLVSDLPRPAGYGDFGELVYTAPPSVAIRSGVIWRMLEAGRGGEHRFTVIQHGNASGAISGPHGDKANWGEETFADRGVWGDAFSSANGPVALSIGSGRVWRVTGACTSASGCAANPGEVEYRIWAGRLTLADEADPVVDSTFGSLASDATLQDSEDVTVAARDAGSGVYRVRVLLGGVERFAGVVDANLGACADVNPGNSDPHEFGRATPCKQSADATFSFDTATWPEGAGELQVLVEDAGGNAVTAIRRQVTVDNVPPPANVRAPSVDGTPRAGSSLSAREGEWTGEGVTFGWRWQRCDTDGATCVDISGADARSYTAGSADVGKRLRVRVRASNAEGATDAFSAASEPVAASVQPVATTQSAGSSVVEPRATAPAPGVPNGAGASALATLTAHESGTDRRQLRVRHGRSAVVTGRLLTPAGRPIAGARLEVLSQVKMSGAPVVALPEAVTGDDGSFRYTVPAGPSRVVRFGYRATIGDLHYARSVDVDVRVVAGLSFRLSRRSLRNGQTLRYLGRLAGPHSGHRFVEVQVRNGRGWQVVCSVRTDRRGAFGCAHKFTRTFVRTTYAFRARVRTQPGLPYEGVASRVRRALVRGR